MSTAASAEHTPTQAPTDEGQSIPTADDLLDNVVTNLIKVPKSTLKRYFTRHYAAKYFAHTHESKFDMKSVQKEWARVLPLLEKFKDEFKTTIDSEPVAQRLLVQMVCASSLLSDPDAAPEVLAPCAIFVSAWCERLNEIFFPGCTPVVFYALWSPFLHGLNVEWSYHGSIDCIIADFEREELSGEEEGVYATVFPGPAPALEGDVLAFTDWASYLKKKCHNLSGIEAVFGGKIRAKHVLYFNPHTFVGGEDQLYHRSFKKQWATDTLPLPEAAREFEDNGDEEEDAAYAAEIKSLANRVSRKNK